MQREERMDTAAFYPPHPTKTPMQIAPWSGDYTTAAAVTNSTARSQLPAGTRVVELRCTVNCYINFGDNTVEASSSHRLFLAGVQVVPVPLDDDGVPQTHVAYLRLDTDGVFQAERLQ